MAVSNRRHESGIALVTTLLVLMLLSAVMAGMFAAIDADIRSHAIDADQTQVYAAAHAGLEKLTSDLVTLFVADVSPSVTQINAVTSVPPPLAGFEYRAPGGIAGSGYTIAFTPDANGNPRISPNTDITAGPYQGFKGLITPYTITVTARSAGGAGRSEVRLRRDLQTVAVPVFQFGVFSESDLTFLSGDNFDFGGRVHTNGSLFVSEASGRTLTFADRITAFGEVIRNYFPNGLLASNQGFTGIVNIPTAIGTPGTYRNLQYAPNEGSVSGMPGSAPNPGWTTLSTGDYKGNIRTKLTGAKRLDLPLVSQGASPIDLIRRPAVNSNENTVNAPVFGQRYFSQASLRILLSDRASDILTLPGVTSTPPVLLAGNWIAAPPNNGTAYGPVGATRPPIAQSIGPASNAMSGTTYSSSYSQIKVNGLPGTIAAGFLMPTLTVVTTAGPKPVVCQGKTHNQFLSCDLPTTSNASSAITATLPSGLTVSATTQQIAYSGSAVTLTVATNGTARFAPGLIWVNETTAVTCEGYNNISNPPQFTNCIGLTTQLGAGTISTHAHSPQNSPLIGGYLKVERQSAAGVWTDVTMEILNLGFGAENEEGFQCADPTLTAVIRIQRLRDNGGGLTCPYAQSQNAFDWWPNALYDAREGNYREVSTTLSMEMGGVIQYISLDVYNLKRWLSGAIGTTGTSAWNNNGYIVYFSDRRGNHNWSATGLPETGEYGWEDVINPASTTGTPNGLLDMGEDVNVSSTLEVYGATPQALVVGSATSPFNVIGARPSTNVSGPQARVNRTVLFRRALKLVHGEINLGVNSLPTAGLTVAAENPVYVEGNYNATMDPNAEPNVPASIIADAVTVLSRNWTDARSFRYPNNVSQRPALTTGYRFAVLAGKTRNFDYPTAGAPQFLFGTDGGVGNFLRLLENWNTLGVAINYRGSVVSLFYSRQATGTYRYSSNVYSFGDRNFTFDSDFLTPALLPPGTPMFRDVNTLTFRQILRPNQ